MTNTLLTFSGGVAKAALFSIVVVGAASLETYAQHGYRVTKQVRFETGKTAAQIKGVIPGILEGHEYLLRAKKGQTVTIGLFSTREDIEFSVAGPDGQTLENAFGLRSWHSELHTTGVYHVVINTASDGKARYTLDVSID